MELIRKGKHIEESIKKNKTQCFNIVQFSAHGNYFKGNKTALDYSTIVKRRGNKDIEIFRPDSIVRTGLQADIFLSTNCQTFNSQFIEVIRNYRGVSNFIAPVNSPYIGNTLIFSMMFYNLLLRKVRLNAVKISDDSIIKAFLQTKLSYSKYNRQDDFRLYNIRYNKIFK